MGKHNGLCDVQSKIGSLVLIVCICMNPAHILDSVGCT